MRWKRLVPTIILLLPIIWFAHAYRMSYLTDDFDAYLQSMGYNPLHPPRGKFPLGSLYDIGQNGNPDLVCPTTETMVDEAVGPDSLKISRVKTGSFSVSGDIADRLNATFGDQYSKNIKLTLSDIRLMEIPAEEDGKIQEVLVRGGDCLRAVTNRLRLGHYICQVESSFSAVAVYQIVDGAGASAAIKEPNTGNGAKADNVKRALTDAVHADTNAQTKDSGNSVLTGNLVFGIKLEPVCISPLNAIFVRTWPQSVFYRGIDYVKYQLIEPLFVKDLFGQQTATLAALY